MKLQVLECDWDDGNRHKCLKHGVSLEEIEQFFRQKRLYVIPDIKHSHEEKRYVAYGQSRNGRPMFVALTLRKQNDAVLIRPISARYMHEKEAREYEEESARIQE